MGRVLRFQMVQFSPAPCLPLLLLLLFSFQSEVLCSIYKVGDLSSWGLPPSSNKQLYTLWAKYNNLKVGDSIFFLYPPSEDSVLQVTKESYDSCSIENPILSMNNGNSLFNITNTGEFYFISGTQGRCEKLQKLRVAVGVNGSSPDSSVSSPPPGASYPTVFGSIPVQASASESPRVHKIVTGAAAVILVLVL